MMLPLHNYLARIRNDNSLSQLSLSDYPKLVVYETSYYPHTGAERGWR